MKPASLALSVVVLATALVWPLSSAIARATARAAAQQGLQPVACAGGDVTADSDDDDDGDADELALPPGHPSLGLELPPGHPPLSMDGLPPGHPPVGDALPPGHPPVASGHGQAAPLPGLLGGPVLLSI